MKISPKRVAPLLLALAVGSGGCAEDRGTPDFSFDPGEQDAAVDLGPDSGFDGPTTSLQVFHNSPDLAASTLDVYARIHGESILVADNLEFRNYTPFLPVPVESPWDAVLAVPSSNEAGALQSDEVVTSVDGIKLSTDTANLAVVHGFVDTTRSQLPPIDITLRRDVRTTPGRDAVNALFFHGSPDVPTIDVSPSNAYEQRILYDDVGYGEFSDEYEQFTQPDVLDISTAEGTFVTNLQPPLDVQPSFGGGAVTGATSGRLTPADASDPGFRVAVFSNNPSVVGTRDLDELPVRSGEPATLLNAGARIRFVHAASAEGFETVDLEVGGEPENISNLGFSEASDFYSLPAGASISVEIAGADSSVERTFSVTLPDSGIPAARTVFVTGNGQNREVELRTVDAEETARFGYTDHNPRVLEGNVIHALTTESYSSVDVSLLDTSDEVLRSPVTLDYGESFGGAVGPAADLGTLRVSAGPSNFDFDLSPITDGTYATIYLADAPTALGLSAYALVDDQPPVELPLE